MGNKKGKDKKQNRNKKTKKKPQGPLHQIPASQVSKFYKSYKDDLLALALRVQEVLDFWKDLPQAQRLELLSIDLATLRSSSKGNGIVLAMTETGVTNTYWEASLKETLHEGVRRLRTHGTTKTWRIDQSEAVFCDRGSFREHLRTSLVPEHLQPSLPGANDLRGFVELADKIAEFGDSLEEANGVFGDRNIPKPPLPSNEEDIEREVQKKLAKLTSRNAGKKGLQFFRDVAACSVLLSGLLKFHEGIFNLCMDSIMEFLTERLPEGTVKSRKGHFDPEDLFELSADDVCRLNTWIFAKSSSLMKDLRPECEVRRDPDHIELLELVGDDRLGVTSMWIEHLYNPKAHITEEDEEFEEDEEEEEDEWEDDDEEYEDSSSDSSGGEGANAKKSPLDMIFQALPNRDPVVLWVYDQLSPQYSQLVASAKLKLGSSSLSPAMVCQALIRVLEEQQRIEATHNQSSKLLHELVKQGDVGAIEKVMEPKPYLKRKQRLLNNDQEVFQDLENETWEEVEELGQGEEGKEGSAASNKQAGEQGSMTADQASNLLSKEVARVSAKLQCLSLQVELAKRRLQHQLFMKFQREVQYRRLQQLLEQMRSEESNGQDDEVVLGADVDKVKREDQLAEVEGLLKKEERQLEGASHTVTVLQDIIEARNQSKVAAQGWLEQLNALSSTLALLASLNISELSLDASQAEEQQKNQRLEQLLSKIQREVVPLLMTGAAAELIKKSLTQLVALWSRSVEESYAVAKLLEGHILRLAMDDSSSAISALLLVPLLRDRLYDKAVQRRHLHILAAEEEILRMEQEEKRKKEAKSSKSKKKRASGKKTKVDVVKGGGHVSVSVAPDCSTGRLSSDCQLELEVSDTRQEVFMGMALSPSPVEAGFHDPIAPSSSTGQDPPVCHLQSLMLASEEVGDLYDDSDDDMMIDPEEALALQRELCAWEQW